MLTVLVGCEESGTVRDAFLQRGHDAYSCDLLPTRSPIENRHYQCDIYDALYAKQWDIIILHPDCTKLAVSGNRWYGRGTAKHNQRLDAIIWTAGLWQTAKKLAKVGAALENPVGVLSGYPGMGKGGTTYMQYIQPYEYGHGETKKTCLFLYKLPPLVPTNIVEGRESRIIEMGPSPTRKRDRSVTYKGIAEAMANQWGALC